MCIDRQLTNIADDVENAQLETIDSARVEPRVLSDGELGTIFGVACTDAITSLVIAAAQAAVAR